MTEPAVKTKKITSGEYLITVPGKRGSVIASKMGRMGSAPASWKLVFGTGEWIGVEPSLTRAKMAAKSKLASE